MAVSKYELTESYATSLDSAREYGELVLRVVLGMSFSQFRSPNEQTFVMLLSDAGKEPDGVGNVIDSLVKPMIESFYAKYFGDEHFINIDNTYATISVSDIGSGEKRVVVFVPAQDIELKPPKGIHNIAGQRGLFFDVSASLKQGVYELVSGVGGYNDGKSALPGKHRVVYNIDPVSNSRAEH